MSPGAGQEPVCHHADIDHPHSGTDYTTMQKALTGGGQMFPVQAPREESPVQSEAAQMTTARVGA